MRRIVLGALAFAFLLIGTSFADAAARRKSWGFGGWGGGAFPTGQRFVRDQTRSGFAFGGQVHYRFGDIWAAVLSYDSFKLPNDSQLSGSAVQYRVQGAALSGMVSFPGGPEWAPFAQLGLGVGTPDQSQPLDNLFARAALGLEYFIAPRISVSPVVRYFFVARTGSSNVEVHAIAPGLSLTYYFNWEEWEGKPDRPKPPVRPLDSDGDGVRDEKDQCPETPPGVAVNEVGCPKPVGRPDMDQDGVPDDVDQCPGTPPGVSVNVQGCPQDTDGDGVPDAQDKCPGTPPGVAVDADGCPRDSDGDGVPDPQDKCPDTPKGLAVNAEGCPELKPEEKVSIELNVLFDTGKDFVKPRYDAEVKKVADFMKAYPETRAEIEGHTDNVGSEAMNVQLSQRRADSVRRVLIQKFGIEPARLTARGYGPRKPIASNDTEAGREKNRRVVATLEAIKK